MPDATPAAPNAPTAAPAVPSNAAATASANSPNPPAGAAADPNAPAATENTEAPKTESAEPPKPADLAPKLGRVAQRSAALREQQQMLEAQKKQFEDARKQLEEDAAEAKKYRALRENPLAMVRELGLSPQQLLEMASKGDAVDPKFVTEIQEAKAKAAEVEKMLAAQKKEIENFQAQQLVAQRHGRIQALIEKGGERWEFARADPDLTPDYVLRAAIAHAQANRITTISPGDEDRVFEQVLDRLEKHLESKYEKVKAVPKWEKRFSAKPAAPAARPASPAAPSAPPTLSNSMAAQPPSSPKPAPKLWARENDVELVKAKYANLIEQSRQNRDAEKAKQKSDLEARNAALRASLAASKQ